MCARVYLWVFDASHCYLVGGFSRTRRVGGTTTAAAQNMHILDIFLLFLNSINACRKTHVKKIVSTLFFVFLTVEYFCFHRRRVRMCRMINGNEQGSCVCHRVLYARVCTARIPRALEIYHNVCACCIIIILI